MAPSTLPGGAAFPLVPPWQRQQSGVSFETFRDEPHAARRAVAARPRKTSVERRPAAWSTGTPLVRIYLKENQAR
jgi:hypothetical protein